MTTLGPLYLYTPRSMREHIEEHGLVPDDVVKRRARPDLLLSTDAAEAWGFAGETARAGEKYDLWQIELEDGDDVTAEPSWGPHIKNVHLRTPIPASRVVWIAARRVTQLETAWRDRTPAPDVAKEPRADGGLFKPTSFLRMVLPGAEPAGSINIGGHAIPVAVNRALPPDVAYLVGEGGSEVVTMTGVGR